MRTLCFLLMLCLLSGCEGVQATYIPLKSASYPPRHPLKDIQILAGNFDQPYEELGIIIIRKYPGSLEEEIQEKFQELAMMRGGDAVIHVQASKKSFFSLSPFFFSFPFPGIEAKGVVIRFKDQGKKP